MINTANNFGSTDNLQAQHRELYAKLEEVFIGDKQSLVLSLLFTIYDDLRAMHSHLDKFQITNKIDQMYLLGLMTKQGTHNRLLMESLDYVR